jgi:hypothetical protein
MPPQVPIGASETARIFSDKRASSRDRLGVQALFRQRDDEPVVMSYTVEGGFPNVDCFDMAWPWPEGVSEGRWAALSNMQAVTAWRKSSRSNGGSQPDCVGALAQIQP